MEDTGEMTEDGRRVRRRVDDMNQSDKTVWSRVAHEDRDPLRSISGKFFCGIQILTAQQIRKLQRPPES